MLTNRVPRNQWFQFRVSRFAQTCLLILPFYSCRLLSLQNKRCGVSRAWKLVLSLKDIWLFELILILNEILLNAVPFRLINDTRSCKYCLDVEQATSYYPMGYSCIFSQHYICFSKGWYMLCLGSVVAVFLHCSISVSSAVYINGMAGIWMCIPLKILGDRGSRNIG